MDFVDTIEKKQLSKANRIYEMENGMENAKLRVNTGIKYY